jgi:subtilisin family serine protease
MYKCTGEEFAMISGTSMATPHIAGIAAVLKQQNPTWGPAIINSALSTTASTKNPDGSPLQAQQFAFGGSSNNLLGTPFDYGSGAVNATAALDPGLVFQAGQCHFFILATKGLIYPILIGIA